MDSSNDALRLLLRPSFFFCSFLLIRLALPFSLALFATSASLLSEAESEEDDEEEEDEEPSDDSP
jgi:hypothetical protein